MSENDSNDKGLTAKSLIADLKRARPARCSHCKTDICGHEVLLSIAMGFKNSPRCLNCLATALDQEVAAARDFISAYIQRRDCYRGAWEWASRDEGVKMVAVPSCLLSRSATKTVASDLAESCRRDPEPTTDSTIAEWDAGEMACGDLVLELRQRLRDLAPGSLFKLTARDTGAPEDLPAWCRLTGHDLLRAEPPNYWIKRKEK